MTDPMVPFDDIRSRVTALLRSFSGSLKQIGQLYVVRDLMGRVRLTVSEAVESSEPCRATLAQLADRLHETLGTRSYGAKMQSCLWIPTCSKTSTVPPGMWILRFPASIG